MSDHSPLTVKCPHCGTEWELDEEECRLPLFTCGTCSATFSIEPVPEPIAVAEVSALPPVRLSQLVIVFLRLMTITLALQTLSFLITSIALITRYQTSGIQDGVICVVMALSTALVWTLSPLVARLVTSNRDSSIHCGGLKLVDLYSFAFVMVGIYYAVDSLGPALTWLHYNMRTENSLTLSYQQQQNFYNLFRYLSNLILGTMLVFNSRRFAIRLIRYQEKHTHPLFPE